MGTVSRRVRPFHGGWSVTAICRPGSTVVELVVLPSVAEVVVVSSDVDFGAGPDFVACGRVAGRR
jgi:hypothetical protein